MIRIRKPNENPFRQNTKVARAWRIVRGYGGCPADECVATLDAAKFARHGKDQFRINCKRTNGCTRL